jgi:hypothetical protein
MDHVNTSRPFGGLYVPAGLVWATGALLVTARSIR